MRTADLTGALLEYWMARAEGVPADQLEIREVPRTDWKICVHTAPPIPGWMTKPERPLPYSTNWALTGPLLEKHSIGLRLSGGEWYAHLVLGRAPGEFGDTPLIAICRAVVRAAFGDEVEDLPCA